MDLLSEAQCAEGRRVDGIIDRSARLGEIVELEE